MPPNEASHVPPQATNESPTTRFLDVGVGESSTSGLNMNGIQCRQPLPLVEKNRRRKNRSIYVKWRPWTRHVDHTAVKSTLRTLAQGSKSLGNWAVEVGDYTHEIIIESGTITHFRGEWIDIPVVFEGDTKSTVIEKCMKCGVTNMTDTDINAEAERLLRYLQFTEPEALIIRQSSKPTIFDTTQRFVRKLATSIALASTSSSSSSHYATKAKVLAFFTRTSLPEDLVYLCVKGLGVLAVAVITGASSTRRTQLIDKGPPMLFYSGIYIAASLLRSLAPLAERLEKERQYIKEHGEFDVLDNRPPKSGMRKVAEKAFVEVVNKATDEREVLNRRLRGKMVEARPKLKRMDTFVEEFQIEGLSRR